MFECGSLFGIRGIELPLQTRPKECPWNYQYSVASGSEATRTMNTLEGTFAGGATVDEPLVEGNGMLGR